ncbi:M42 family metallopeptidase [Candidatus Darwinibacter acetoxidans]|mgnify:CR=1 FL=1|nr:M42 family metallopeptidase [Limnochordia bacterium]MDI9465196.1 M42 family metallopeptidase [Bacillota bacterium]NLO94688.1 M42 family metallopeptidase [Bacillota bacterium]HAN94933.1 aminopeptidase [Bacillota bacterium]HOB39883.1 M42 family metallopeptidase [Limnochordia bacterium]
MDVKDVFRSLSEAPGVSGYEFGLLELIKQGCPWADEARTDKLGNLILLKRGQGPEPRPKVMLAAHMDEIGLIITKIEKEGFLRFSTVGGFDQRVLLAQEVVIHGRKGTLTGIIGAKPPHIQAPGEQGKAVKMEDLFIDAGFASAEEAKRQVRVGDLVTLKRRVSQLAGSFLSGKAFDDRAGVAAILECFQVLSTVTHQADVYGVATVQEEVGLRGAVTSTYGIVPDIGIAIDVGFGDSPGLSEEETIKLSKGPGIAIGPHVHPKLHARMVETAKEWNISYSLDPSPYPGGTDAYAMQVARSGVATILLSIPLRYMHTPVETLDYRDIQATGRLMAMFIAGLDHEFVEGLTCF